jgi:hypothetical protein
VSSTGPNEIEWLAWRQIAALPHSPEDSVMAVGSIETIEIEWLVWVVGDRGIAPALGRAPLGFDEMFTAAQVQVLGDLEKQAACCAELRNVHGLSQQYGFDAATLLDRLRALDPLQRMQVLDLVEAQR